MESSVHVIEDLSETAREELKRADHSIFVSLKYSRTIEVMKNTIKRLISAYDLALLEVCEHLKTKKKIPAVPSIAKLRADTVLKLYPQLKKDIQFYFALKEIDKASFTKQEEYRKNVAFNITLNNKPHSINIDLLKSYYNQTVAFIDQVEALVHGK